MNQNSRKYFWLESKQNPRSFEIKVISDEQNYITNESLERNALIEFVDVLIGELNNLKGQAVEIFERDF